MFLPLIFLLLVHACCIILGLLFCDKILFGHRSIRNHLVCLIFSSTTSHVCMLFLIFLLEMQDIFDQPLRHFYWHICIVMLLLLLLVVIPVLIINQIWFSLLGKSMAQDKISIIVKNVFLILLFFIYVKSGSSHSKSGFGTFDVFSLEHSLSRLCTIGVTIVAFLSGHGAVSLPYSCILMFFRPITKDTILQQERNVLNCLSMISEKKQSLLLYMKKNSNKDNESYRRIWGFGLGNILNKLTFNQTIPVLKSFENWPWRNHFLYFLYRRKKDIKSQLEEIGSMIEFKNHLILDLTNMKHQEKKHRFGRTIFGKIFFLCSYFVSLYCVWKFLSSLVNVIFNRTGQVDGVTLLIEKSAPLFASRVDLRLWTQQISILLVGIISVTSINSLLQNLAKLFRRLSAFQLHDTVILLISEVAGLHLLSSLLLMRNNLPENHRQALGYLLGNLDYQFYRKLFDLFFLLSYTLSGLFYFLCYYLKDNLYII